MATLFRLSGDRVLNSYIDHSFLDMFLYTILSYRLTAGRLMQGLFSALIV